MTPIPPIPEDPPEICKEYCKDCGAETATWFTDSDIWNLLDTPGILCPNCFVYLIEARGFATTGWKLVPEERIAKLTAEVEREKAERLALEIQIKGFQDQFAEVALATGRQGGEGLSYGLYIGISAIPIRTASSKEDLRAQVPHLDVLDRAQGWTIAPVGHRDPWPAHVEGPRAFNLWWLSAGAALLVFSVWVFTNLIF